MLEEVPIRWNRPIFVASMGRSGSTLLQRVLNVHPEVTIWGEHGGFLSGLLQSYDALSEPMTAQNLEVGNRSKDEVVGELSDKGSFKPWVSPFDQADAEDRIREMVLGLFTDGLDPSIRWGFKEIRYSRDELATLMTMFPEAHMVILAREFRGFAQSRFFAFGNTSYDFDSEEGRQAARKRLSKMSRSWIRRYRGLLAVAKQHPERSSVIAYRDLVAGSPRPIELFAELGEDPPPASAIDDVLGAVAGSSFRHNSAARDNRDALVGLIDEAKINWAAHERLGGRLGCHE